jgi:hypothetical protein
MRLTIGPHPAAVYWRGRAVVLVGLAIVVLIVTYACSGSSPSGADGGHPAASVTSTLQHPTSGQPTTPSPTPTPTPFTLPQSTASGPCGDAELNLTAGANPASPKLGEPVMLTLVIENASNRTCARDIGAEPQELMLLDGETVIWSSDDCSTNHSSDIQSFNAGQSRTFSLTWSGRRSRSGVNQKTCTDGTAPLPGEYQLVARLGTKKSAPFAVHLTA